MSAWYENGRPQNVVPIDDRGLHYGDGVFETIAVRGGEPRLWSFHIERLHDGCCRLGIEFPAETRLRRDVAKALHESGLDTRYAMVKLIVSAGSGPRGYQRPDKSGSRVLIGVFDGVRPAVDDTRNGVRTIRCKTIIAIQPMLAGIKSLNRLDQVLARKEWQNPEVFEGLMCDTDGRLICGTMSNVFVVHKQLVATPILDRCGVAGVMRRHVLELLSVSGPDTRECVLDWNSVTSADEIFLTNSQFGVLPVRMCDQCEFGVGPTTRAVMSLLANSGIEECVL